MKTVTISVSSTDKTKRRFQAAFKGKPQGAHISFPTVELLWKVLAPNRMALVRALTGAGVAYEALPPAKPATVVSAAARSLRWSPQIRLPQT